MRPDHTRQVRRSHRNRKVDVTLYLTPNPTNKFPTYAAAIEVATHHYHLYHPLRNIELDALIICPPKKFADKKYFKSRSQCDHNGLSFLDIF